MDKNYEAAVGYTDEARLRGKKRPAPFLAKGDRDKIAIYQNPSGFQFVGVCADPKTLGRVMLANYNSPAAMIGRLIERDCGLELMREAMIGWAFMVGSDERRRLFLNQMSKSDAKRAQGCAFGPNGELWLVQNTDRGLISRIRKDEEKNRWQMLDPIVLQGEDVGYIEGFTIDGERIFVLFNPRDPNKPNAAVLRVHNLNGELQEHSFNWPKANWVYGPAIHDGHPWFITAEECETPYGIYCEDQLIVPGVTGHGLCFPFGNNGPAFVVEYGEGKSDWGAPALFINIPASAFKQ